MQDFIFSLNGRVCTTKVSDASGRFNVRANDDGIRNARVEDDVCLGRIELLTKVSPQSSSCWSKLRSRSNLRSLNQGNCGPRMSENGIVRQFSSRVVSSDFNSCIQ